MRILVKRTIHYYINKYPQAEKALQLWVSEFSKLEFANFNDIKNILALQSFQPIIGSFSTLKATISGLSSPSIFYKRPAT